MGMRTPSRGEGSSYRRLFICAVVAGALLLAGCSTNPNSGTRSSAGASKGTTTTTKALPGVKGTTTTTNALSGVKGTTTTTNALSGVKGTTTTNALSGVKGTTTTTNALSGVTTIPYSPAKNARQDVTTSGPCTSTGASWILSGTVKNSSRSARTYQIVVDFVTQPGFTVLDTKIVTTASVGPGASLPWDATGAAGHKNVACVIRQVQAPA